MINIDCIFMLFSLFPSLTLHAYLIFYFFYPLIWIGYKGRSVLNYVRHDLCSLHLNEFHLTSFIYSQLLNIIYNYATISTKKKSMMTLKKKTIYVWSWYRGKFCGKSIFRWKIHRICPFYKRQSLKIDIFNGIAFVKWGKWICCTVN